MSEIQTNEPQLENSTIDSDPDNTVTFKRTHLYAVLLPLAFVAGITVGYIFWGRGTPQISEDTGGSKQVSVTGEPSAQGQADTQATPPQVNRYDIPEDDDPSIGPEDAPITMIEFSDYECPYCTKWHDEVWPLLQENYSDKLRLVYRDFPLTSIHGNAAKAAEAANCAGEQDSYWEFHDKLLSGQRKLSKDTYLEYAADLDLDEDDFEQCLESGRYTEEVEADLNFAVELGVRSTPTFFLNGIAIVGAQPYEVFEDVIEKELAGEIPK